MSEKSLYYIPNNCKAWVQKASWPVKNGRIWYVWIGSYRDKKTGERMPVWGIINLKKQWEAKRIALLINKTLQLLATHKLITYSD